MPFDPYNKRHAENRDILTYPYLLGLWPTHLRPERDQELMSLCEHKPVRGGGWFLRLGMSAKLHMDDHPRVRKFRTLQRQGFFPVPPTHKARRCWQKIRMRKGSQEIILKADGSVLDT